MDFNDTPEQAEFRAEARAWLDANAEPKVEGKRSLNRRIDSDKGLAIAKEWQAKKADAGYACMTFPEEYGGKGSSPIFQVIYDEEEERYDVPRSFFAIGLGMCAPTMIAYATEEQKQRFVPPMVRGEEVWCQLFSEPAAGSDLAGLGTRAQQDGDDWVINGQKVWTSGAHYSDYGILVTRHDRSLAKHKGLTFFFLDMNSPGVEVRPIKQISGASDFNEVYFTNVRIPDSQRLGGVGDGWQVSITTLMNERLAVGGAPPPDAMDLFKLASRAKLENGRPALEDSAVREKLAEWYVQAEGLSNIRARSLTALARGSAPGPEASISKVVSAPKLQDLSSFGIDLMDIGGAEIGGHMPDDSLYQNGLLYAPGLRIAGGTDEILRNIIAERVLGLPGDIRVDRDKPFDQIPTGR